MPPKKQSKQDEDPFKERAVQAEQRVQALER